MNQPIAPCRPDPFVRPNIDPTNGVAYGVFAGNKRPELIDEIQQKGVSETYTAWKEEVKRSLENELGDLSFDGKDPTDAVVAAEAVKEFTAAVRRGILNWTSERDGEAIATEICEDLFDAPSLTFDIAEVIDQAVDALNEDVTFDEECFYYEDKKNGIAYRLGWLGGAQIVFVVKSPWLIYCAPCSPCCPNAGDGDSPRDLSSVSCIAYSLLPSDLTLEEDKEIFLAKISAVLQDELVLTTMPLAEAQRLTSTEQGGAQPG